MNLITHDKAYSIFPRETFEDRRSLIFVKDGDSTVKARERYEERGWTFVEGYEIQQRDPLSAFGKGIRRLGDSKCWSVSLHPDQDRTKSVAESNSWKLVYMNSLTAFGQSQHLPFHLSRQSCARVSSKKESYDDWLWWVSNNQSGILAYFVLTDHSPSVRRVKIRTFILQWWLGCRDKHTTDTLSVTSSLCRHDAFAVNFSFNLPWVWASSVLDDQKFRFKDHVDRIQNGSVMNFYL